MKIAIVNDIHIGKGMEHKGKYRASSHLVEGLLDNFLKSILDQHQPDLLINLGDLIRSEERDLDIDRYRKALSSFNKLDVPIIHVVGNHELRRMRLTDVEACWNHKQNSYGSQFYHGINLIWLGLELDPHNYRIRRLPDNQLDWLKEELARSNHPTLIFTHCAIDDHNVKGNFFFEAYDGQDSTALFLKNQTEIRKVIASCKHVISVIQAHLHYFHVKEMEGMPYITCPAMGDNICGPNVEDNVPEIYTLLSYDAGHLIVKAYSGKYCFAGCEFNPI